MPEMTDCRAAPVTDLSADAETLNHECFCIGTDLEALHAWLRRDLGKLGLATAIAETHPHLFATAPVFVAREHVLEMERVVRAIEEVAENPRYAAHALAVAPPIAQRLPLAQGILQGYDFHLTEAGPRLIEINTNAGGALLNAELIRAQRACCQEVADLLSGPNTGEVADRIVAMFLKEWGRARGPTPLTRIAIVDQQPAEQYLYPEFLLFARLFQSKGIDAVIADSAELTLRDGRLHHARGPIDMVYNRVTDFYFEDPVNVVLRDAWLAGTVISPNPHEHAIYANKHNLEVLCDADRLRAWDVAPATIAALGASIPQTEAVQASAAETLWQNRNRLFFKPATGFGSRAAYRGDKLTRRVFAEILASDYVAQALVPPGLRLHAPNASAPLKFDLRLYAHRGETLLVAARMYQGQTTNFRTPGGGFAPVYYPPAANGLTSPACDG